MYVSLYITTSMPALRCSVQGGLAAFLAAAAEGGSGGWGGGTPGGEDLLLQYKWWRDGDEPQYYIVAPGVSNPIT